MHLPSDTEQWQIYMRSYYKIHNMQKAFNDLALRNG